MFEFVKKLFKPDYDKGKKPVVIEKKKTVQRTMQLKRHQIIERIHERIARKTREYQLKRGIYRA